MFIPTFATIDEALEAARDFCQAEILAGLSVSMLGTGVVPEGNDEHWAMIQKIPPEVAEQFKSSLVLVIGGQSPGELAYKENCIQAITDKRKGEFLDTFNEPRALARAFIDLYWSIGVPSLRITGDFLPSSSSPDGSPDMLKRLAREEGKIKKQYEDSGAFFSMGGGERPVTWRPEEHLSIGAQGISTAMYDPHDPVSLKAGRKFIDELFDPRGHFQRFGVPSRGGCLQIEPVNHVHQNWGRLYDNYDVWLMKIKRMLDPNRVADWTAYIPPEYPDYDKEGDYVLPSYGNNENLSGQ